MRSSSTEANAYHVLMRRVGIVFASLVVCVPLIGTLPATAAPTTTERKATSSATSAPRASLDWRSCGSGSPARCATLTVPRDWGDRRVEGTYRISVARIPA